MHKLLKNFHFFLIAALLLGFIFFVLPEPGQKLPDSGATNTSSPLEDTYDYYISGMSLSRFDTQGVSGYSLNAQRVRHYPDSDIAILELPVFRWGDTDSTPWELTAKSGVLRPDKNRNTDILQLTQDVIAGKMLDNGSSLQISTQSLTVHPDTREADTKSPVLLETPDTRINSLGMHAQLANDKINLLSNVRGTHD